MTIVKPWIIFESYQLLRWSKSFILILSYEILSIHVTCFYQAKENIQEYGNVLLDQLPDETTQLLLELTNKKEGNEQVSFQIKKKRYIYNYLKLHFIYF